MATFYVNRHSFNPPAADDVGEILPPWVLVELQAYVAKRENATTAWAKTRTGKQIQVTFCVRRPPLVSYLCVHCPDDEIPIEPNILATQDGLALLRVTVGCEKDVSKEIDYYIYKAADDRTGKPSLQHLKRPGLHFNVTSIGILPDRDDEYILAGFRESVLEPLDRFVLCLYDSRVQDWTTYKVTLDQQHQQQWGGDDFDHNNCRVMPTGDGATMAFVDLWRGVLLCNLHQVQKEAHLHGNNNSEPLPLLRYVTLPRPLQRNKSLEGDANLYRDVAVVNNRLKYVELQLHWKPSVFSGGFFTDGWMAAIFSRPVSSLDRDGCWRRDCRVDSKELNVRGNPHFGLLPKLVNDEGMPLPPFRRLDVCQPVLGLQEDADILYFTTKISRLRDDAWVTAVDMRSKKLLGVTPFCAARSVGINFDYVQSTISRHLLGKNVGDDHQDVEEMEVLGSQKVHRG